MIKKLILIFVALFLALLFIPPAKAAENWHIDNFISNINVLNSGQIEVIEEISVDFGNNSKHGIFRNIPYIYHLSNDQTLYSTVTTISVTQDGQKAQFTNYSDSQYQVIKIGSPDKIISAISSPNS